MARPWGPRIMRGLWISDTAVADGTRMRARGSRVAPGADQRGLIAEAQRLAEQLLDRAEAMRRAPAPRRTGGTAACRARLPAACTLACRAAGYQSGILRACIG